MSWRIEPGSDSEDGFDTDESSYENESDVDEMMSGSDVDGNTKKEEHHMPDFTTGTEWNTDVYSIQVRGSLRELRERSGNDNKPLKLCLDRGISIERCSAGVKARLDDMSGKHTREEIYRNPKKVESKRDIVKTVDVTGKNGFPVPMRLKIGNLMGSSTNSYNDGRKIDRCLVISMHPNEKFKNTNVMNNRVSDQDLQNIRDYNQTAGDLKSGEDVQRFPTKMGEDEMLMVRHTKDHPHMVLKKIEMTFATDPDATEDERDYTKKKNKLPEHIMTQYQDTFYKVDKKTFDRYAKKCADEIRNRPTSDVSNPYAYLSRMGTGGHFPSSKGSDSNAVNLMESGATIGSPHGSGDGVCSWTDLDGLEVGSLANKKMEVATRNLDRVYQLNLSVRVRHADRDDPSMQKLESKK